MIVNFARARKWELIYLTALAILNAVASFAVFASVSTIVRHVVSLTTIVQSAVLLLLLIGSALLTQGLSAKLGADFVEAMRRNVADRLITGSYVPASRHSAAGISAFINDIAQIAPLSGIAPVFSYNVLLTIVLTCYLLYVSVPLALVVVVQICALLSVSTILTKRVIPAFDLLRSADGTLFQSINAIQLAKKQLVTDRLRAAHFREHVVFPSISTARSLLERAHLRAGHHQAWSSVVFFVIILLTAIFSRVLFPLPPSQFASFMVACLLLIAPANSLVSAAQPISRGLAAVRRLDRFLGVVPQVASVSAEVDMDWRTLSCTDIRYVYDDGGRNGAEIGPLTLAITRGDIIFVTGSNGSGKSTLLLMLSRILKPVSGVIRLDSCDLEEVDESYRRRLSIIFCDFHVFDHILDRDGSPAASAAVESWIGELGLSDVVNVIDGKLSRTDASTGQRKRLALLQMLLEDRELIILDEIASDLDPNFKRYFYEVLLPRLRSKGKTVVLATHDTDYLSCADQILQMEGGQVVASTGLGGRERDDRRVS